MFIILLAIKYIYMQFIGLKKQWNFKDLYIYQTNGHQFNGNGH